MLTLACLPMIATVANQIGLMVPNFSSAAEAAAIQALRGGWRADPQINNVLAELNILRHRDPDDRELQSWAAADPANALPTWAALLVELRKDRVNLLTHSSTDDRNGNQLPRSLEQANAPASAPSTTAATNAPAEVLLTPEMDERIRSLLSAIEAGPPLRLHLARLRDSFIAVLGDAGVDVRRAVSAFEILRWTPELAAYRPFMRETANRLIGLGDRYRRQNRPADAARAYAAAVRLLTDCVQDSPLPDVALLAAERLPVALRSLGDVRKNNDASKTAEALRSFRECYLKVRDQDINLLPVTFGPKIAPEAHDRALRSMVAAIACLAFGWMLALVCMVQIVIVGATRSIGPVPLAWRWGWHGIIAAAAIVVLPLGGTTLILMGTPFIWLLSAPSANAMLAAPALVLVLLVLATKVGMKQSGASGGSLLPASIVIGGLLLAFVVSGIAAGLIYRHAELWRPPMSVQLVRGVGFIGGLTCMVVLVAWAVIGWRRRRATNVRIGTWARAGLAVTAPAMTVLLLLATTWLALDAHYDAVHRAAFTSALSNPLDVSFAPASAFAKDAAAGHR